MGKPILYLPANGLHSNVLPNRYKQLLAEKGGIDIIGTSGVPVAISFQGIDELAFERELVAEARLHASIELVHGNFSHSLLPLVGDRQAKFELERGFKGNCPVWFTAEFYNPDQARLPKGLKFLVLESKSNSYSYCLIDPDVQNFTPWTPEAESIRYGNHTGILMRGKWFDPILAAWFRFQRDPLTADEKTGNKMPVEFLCDQIEALANDGSDRVVVMPLDLEAPFVGSAWGSKIWTVFFEEIHKRGLQEVFTTFTANDARFEQNAIKSERPHRELGDKWTKEEVQIKYLNQLNEIRPVTFREIALLCLASNSDILSAWERKIGEGKGKSVVLSGTDHNGQAVKLPISFSQPVIDMQKSALLAIREGQPFAEVLKNLKQQPLFIERAIELAEQLQL